METIRKPHYIIHLSWYDEDILRTDNHVAYPLSDLVEFLYDSSYEFEFDLEEFEKLSHETQCEIVSYDRYMINTISYPSDKLKTFHQLRWTI